MEGAFLCIWGTKAFRTLVTQMLAEWPPFFIWQYIYSSRLMFMFFSNCCLTYTDRASFAQGQLWFRIKFDRWFRLYKNSTLHFYYYSPWMCRDCEVLTSKGVRCYCQPTHWRTKYSSQMCPDPVLGGCGGRGV